MAMAKDKEFEPVIELGEGVQDLTEGQDQEGQTDKEELFEPKRDKPSVDAGVAFKETVVSINRVAKVVSGGKRLAFSAVAVVGDGLGQVGVGKGKARDVQNSITKAVNQAKKHLMRVPLSNLTIPAATEGNFGAARVLLKPAAPGTGVIAGPPVRAIVEACGIKDILTKNLGTSNTYNVLYATLDALKKLETKEDVAKRRGKKPEEI